MYDFRMRSRSTEHLTHRKSPLRTIRKGLFLLGRKARDSRCRSVAMPSSERLSSLSVDTPQLAFRAIHMRVTMTVARDSQVTSLGSESNQIFRGVKKSVTYMSFRAGHMPETSENLLQKLFLMHFLI